VRREIRDRFKELRAISCVGVQADANIGDIQELDRLGFVIVIQPVPCEVRKVVHVLEDAKARIPVILYPIEVGTRTAVARSVAISPDIG